MALITYGAAAPDAPAQPRRRNAFMRFLKALEESRMRAAQREIARYRHLLPQELEQAAEELGPRTEKGLPFVR
jgi:hypothetical protein